MGSCCRTDGDRTDGDEMFARWFWGGCGWNELLEEPRVQKPRLEWLRGRIARAMGAGQGLGREHTAQGDGREETLRI